MTTRYKFYTRIKRIEERSRAKRAYKVNPNDPNSEIVVEREPMGWFVVLEGSGEALSIGDIEPDFKVGDTVCVTLEATDCGIEGSIKHDHAHADA